MQIKGKTEKLVWVLDSRLRGALGNSTASWSPQKLQARACLLLDLLLNLLLLPHHFAQLLLLLLQLILYLVHTLLVLLYLLVLRGQFLIELLDFHFIVIKLKELQLYLSSYHLVLQALVAVSLFK